MTEHAVVIAGGGPTGMMLAAELALAKVDVAVVERRPDHVLVDSGPADFTRARSRCWISVGSLIGSSRRVRWPRPRCSP
jgi:glycine/D-amino acid oxidase-like deaminating enzyme